MRYLLDIDDYKNQIFVSSESVKEFIQLIQTERVVLKKSLIISQAITEKIPLISSDTKFPKYTKFGLNFIPNR